MEIQTVTGIGFECNSYLIGDEEGMILVDVGTGGSDRVYRSIPEADDCEKRVRMIVLTHTHFDHAGGTRRMVDMTGAEVAVHPAEGGRISSGDFSVTLAPMFGATMEPFSWRPLEEGAVISAGVAEFEVLHLPGHSVGSIALWEGESRSLIAGDTVFSDGGIGRYDLPTGDREQLESSIERIAALGVRDLYPGHGPAVRRHGTEHISMSLEAIRRGI